MPNIFNSLNKIYKMSQMFNPVQDAQNIKKAMEKPKCPLTIIDIVTHRSNAQRQKIVEEYYKQYQKISEMISVLPLVGTFKIH